MDKKINTWAFAILALAVVFLLVGAIGASVTGNSIWDLFRSKDNVQEQTIENTQIETGEVYRGLLAEEYLKAGEDWQFLKGYEAKYDENGDLIYEVVEGYAYAGEKYEITQDPYNPERSSYNLIGQPIGSGGTIMAPGGDPGGSCVCTKGANEGCKKKWGVKQCYRKDDGDKTCKDGDCYWKKDGSTTASGVS